MARPLLSCRELIDFLSDYLEDELPDEQRLRFEEHLSVCPDCVRYLDGYRTTASLASRAFDPDGPLPESVPEELIAGILAARRSARR